MATQPLASGYMNFTIYNLPATAQLTMLLLTPGYAWSNDYPLEGGAGVSLTGTEGRLIRIVWWMFGPTYVTLVAGSQPDSLTLGLPFTYPADSHNPVAKGFLMMNLPGDAQVYVTAGGPQMSMDINGPWAVPIL